jgi:hypothetical protein
MEEKERKIDESWKDSVEKEKDKLPEEEKISIPQANFAFFVTTLGIQVAISLGEIPNPVTNKIEENLEQAQYLIDTLEMLKEKTKNNLSKEEEDLLSGFLYDFHMKFVQKKERINT